MKLVVKLTSGGIEAKGQKWPWGEDLVKNQEILDPARWEKEAGEFWKRAGVRGRVAVVLGKDIIFEKEMGEKDDEKAFWAEVPIEPENMGRLVVKREGKKRLVAVNKGLYEAVVKSLKKVKVIGVFPEGEEKESFLGGNQGWEWWPVIIGGVVALAVVAGAWYLGLRNP